MGTHRLPKGGDMGVWVRVKLHLPLVASRESAGGWMGLGAVAGAGEWGPGIWRLVGGDGSSGDDGVHGGFAVP